MPEALTESFCERCGTRYEFAAPTQLNTMRKTRGLISGLKNYIMSQDALGDAVGDAMRSEEEALAAQQLEAFHESFNFCINCRQYTCLNCWNDDSGRCRTCVPIAGTDDLLERFETSFHAQHPEIAAAAAQAEMDQADLNRRLGLESWPSEDLSHAPANGAETAWPEAELAPTEPEPMVAAVEPEPEPTVADAAMAAAAIDAAGEYPPLRVVAWEEDAAIALEPEPEPVVAEVEVEPEPVVAAEVEVEPEPVAAEVEVEPVVAAEVEPEPVVAEVEAEPAVAEPEPVAGRAPRSRSVRSARPSWRCRSSCRHRRPTLTAWRRRRTTRRLPPARRSWTCSASAIRVRERWRTVRTSFRTARAGHRSPPRRWPCGRLPGCRPPARSGRHRPERLPAP